MSAFDASGPFDAVNPDLTKFQLRILALLAEQDKYGLRIKRELENYYGADVNHGRLYPNLDQLVEQGYVTKYEKDKRTNGYRLTDDGRRALVDELHWLVALLDNWALVDGDVVDAQPTRGDR